MTTTAVREYAGDQRLHRYRTAHLDNPGYGYIIPVCQEDSLYPSRHDREMLSAQRVGADTFCPRCVDWYWRDTQALAVSRNPDGQVSTSVGADLLATLPAPTEDHSTDGDAPKKSMGLDARHEQAAAEASNLDHLE